MREGCIEICPGCRYRGFSSEESTAKKQAWAERWLSPLRIDVRNLAAPGLRWAYRRKALLHAEKHVDGWRLGLLKRWGWETELVEIPDCPLHAPEINRTLKALKPELPADIPLAFILCSGTILTLVLKCAASEKWRAWAKSLALPEILSVQINWNPSAGAGRPVSSRHQEVVSGPRLLRDGEGVSYGALSFRQQIPEMESLALGLAEKHFDLFAPSSVVDLYCGGGATLARWRSRGRKAVGVELSGEAVDAARENAPGTMVLKGRVEHRLPQLEEWLQEEGQKENFAIYTNPPREGHAPEVNQWIASSGALCVAYLSCNPKTLARDLSGLEAAYEFLSAHPFDFFPQTDHVECLALLRRRTGPRAR
jgi:23S rRNA (uracil1939-C5)-methyltransferase